MSWKKYLVSKSTSIADSMKLMGKLRISTLVVVNQNNEVFGTVTDGDFRRAILNKKSTMDNIEGISNINPVIIRRNEKIETSVIEKNKIEGIFVYPVLNEKSQVIDIFDCLDFSNNKKNHLLKNKVLVLAGGEGKRLHPITIDTPKPLIKIGGRPIMETSIRSMATYGLNDFIISVNYKKEKIISHFQNLDSFKGKISFLSEEQPLGTIGPFGQLDNLDLPTIVINGDIITKVDFTSLLSFHKKNNADVTICLKVIKNAIPYGVLSTDDLNLLKFDEKPKDDLQINAGIYVFNPEIRKIIGKNKKMDLPELINKLLENKMKVICFPIHEYWIDVGEMSTLERANLEFNNLNFNFYE